MNAMRGSRASNELGARLRKNRGVFFCAGVARCESNLLHVVRETAHFTPTPITYALDSTHAPISLSHHNRKSTGCVTLDPKVENWGWALHCSTMWKIWHLCHYIALPLLKTSNFEEQDVAIILLDALSMQRNSGS